MHSDPSWYPKYTDTDSYYSLYYEILYIYAEGKYCLCIQIIKLDSLSRLAINLHREGATDADDDPGLVEVDPYEEGSLPHVDVIRRIDDLGRIKVTNLNDTMIAIE